MKKILLLFIFLLLITGCKDKESTKNISYDMRKFVITLSIPKDSNYIFSNIKPDDSKDRGEVYLETDNSILVFSYETWVYHVKVSYRTKYGSKEPSLDDYINWCDDKESDINLDGKEVIKINDRKILKYNYLENDRYYGYNYIISLDNIHPQGYLLLKVLYKNKDGYDEIKELDKETKEIINTLIVS